MKLAEITAPKTPATLYHGTSRGNAKRIREHGFSSGHVWLTNSIEEATDYADADAVVACKFEPKNPYVLGARWPVKNHAERDKLIDDLEARDHDCIILVGDPSDTNRKTTWYVVFNAKSVKVKS